MHQRNHSQCSDIFQEQGEIYSFISSMNQFLTINSDRVKQIFCQKLKLHKYKTNELVMEQNTPLNQIYLIKQGSFSLTHISKYINEVYFNLDYFKNFQEEAKESERFIGFRNYELKGNFSYLDKEKIMILERGEIIGDIEWYMKKDVALFNLVANDNYCEILSCNREDFENFIKKIPKKTEKLIEKKIKNLMIRTKEIIKDKKKCKNTRKISIENNIKKQIEFNHLKLKKKEISSSIPNNLKLVKFHKTLISAKKPAVSNNNQRIKINNNCNNSGNTSLSSTIMRSTCESSKLDSSILCATERKERKQNVMISEFKLGLSSIKKTKKNGPIHLNRSALNILNIKKDFPPIKRLDSSFILENKGKLVLNVKSANVLSYKDDEGSLSERKTERSKNYIPTIINKNIFLNQKMNLMLQEKYNLLRKNSSEKNLAIS